MITKPSRNEQSPLTCATHVILLIEDDVQIGQLVTTEISEAGWTVDWAVDGQAGVKKPTLIETVWGVGYRLVSQPDS